MRLDAHQHFWRFDPRRDAWITADMGVLRRDFLARDLLPEMTAHGVDASIAVQADQSEAETLFLLDIAGRHPEVAGVVGWVDLQAPGVADRLQHFSGFGKLRGFRHLVQSESDDRFLLRPDFVRGVRALARFDFTYDLLVYPRQLPAAVELVHTVPEVRFVLDHMAKPAIRSGALGGWRESIGAFAARPNVYCKLSGLVTEADWGGWRAQDFAPYLDVVFAAFGPERLMFGSDWPLCLLAASYGQVKQIIADYIRALAPGEEDGIMGENAARFYGVKQTAWTSN